jgi:flagellar basal-body rod protein FlgB
MLDKIFSSTKVLEKALDATYLRNEAIAQNIANIDTPGYKKKTISFESELQNAMDHDKGSDRISEPPQFIPEPGTARISFSTNSSAVDSIEPILNVENKNLSMRLDGNNVDIDSEMADLTKNQIRYNVLVQSLNGQFSKLRYVISDGRR